VAVAELEKVELKVELLVLESQVALAEVVAEIQVQV
jgi:hypothetical protein